MDFLGRGRCRSSCCQGSLSVRSWFCKPVGSKFIRFGQTCWTGESSRCPVARDRAGIYRFDGDGPMCKRGDGTRAWIEAVRKSGPMSPWGRIQPQAGRAAPAFRTSHASVVDGTSWILFGWLGGCARVRLSIRLKCGEFWRRAIDAMDFADLMQRFYEAGCVRLHSAPQSVCLQGLRCAGHAGREGVPRRPRQWWDRLLISWRTLFLTKFRGLSD